MIVTWKLIKIHEIIYDNFLVDLNLKLLVLIKSLIKLYLNQLYSNNYVGTNSYLNIFSRSYSSENSRGAGSDREW